MNERLFVLDLSGNRVVAFNPDGSGEKTLVTGCRHPDGIAVDIAGEHIYWTNMGVPNRNDGSIERVDLDGGNRRTIIDQGHTFTPKQLQLDRVNRKLYWADREGMRIMRANLDGAEITTLVDRSPGASDHADATRWCVGIALDLARRHLYWTQKGPDDAGLGRIFRAGLDIPKGETSAARSDVELLVDGLPEPIDLELDGQHRVLYWTDRGDPPRGNTVNRLPLEESTPLTPEIVASHLMEGIGIALDVPRNRMFVTDLGGSVYAASLDGSHKRTLAYAQGNLAGIAYLRLED
jgi:hypothetical protein